MKRLSLRLISLVLCSLWCLGAQAQVFPNIPSNTILGRLGSGNPGPPQPIPFDTLANRILTNPTATANQIPVYPGGGGAAVPTTLTTLINTVCASSVTRAACTAIFGYANPDWYGAVADAVYSSGWTGTDNTAAFTAAAASGYPVRFRGHYGIASGLSFSADNTSIFGVGIPYGFQLSSHTDLTSCPSMLVRTGTNTSPLITWAPAAFGAGTRGIIGGGAKGFCTDGNGHAAQIILVEDTQGLSLDSLDLENYTAQAIQFSPSVFLNSGNALSTLAGIQYGRFSNLVIGNGSGGSLSCMVLNSWTGTGPTNASFNVFRDINCNGSTVGGIVDNNGDNNKFFNTSIHVTSGYGLDMSCSSTGGTTTCAGSETFYGLSAPTSIMRGTTTFPAASPGVAGILIYGLDKTNGSATPVLEPGAANIRVQDTSGGSLWLSDDTGTLATGNVTMSGGRFYFQHEGTAGTPDIIFGHTGVSGCGKLIGLSNNANVVIGDCNGLVAYKPFTAPGYTLNSLAMSATAPTVASGFCSTGSPVTALSANNGTAAFDILIGAATCGSTGTLTMPAATTGWVCKAADVTTPASHNIQQTGTQGSTTAVVLTDYSRTAGTAQNFNPADHIHVMCTAY